MGRRHSWTCSRATTPPTSPPTASPQPSFNGANLSHFASPCCFSSSFFLFPPVCFVFSLEWVRWRATTPLTVPLTASPQHLSDGAAFSTFVLLFFFLSFVSVCFAFSVLFLPILPLFSWLDHVIWIQALIFSFFPFLSLPFYSFFLFFFFVLRLIEAGADLLQKSTFPSPVGLMFGNLDVFRSATTPNLRP